MNPNYPRIGYAMDAPSQNFLDTCLFFNTNAFARNLGKLADAAFKGLGLSSAHASLLLLVYETPGINPKDLSRLMQLNPSTITRFIDALVKKKLLKKQAHGKQAFIHPTQKSLDLKPKVASAYKSFILQYSTLLGREEAPHLSLRIARANGRVQEALAATQNDENL